MILRGDEAGEFVMLSALPVMISVIAVLVGIANTVWTWVAKSQTATADRAKCMEDDIDGLTLRVAQLEGDYKHLPTKGDIGRLAIQIENLSGQIRTTETSLNAVNRTVVRIDDFLREKA